MMREALAEEGPLQQKSQWRRNELLGEIFWGRIALIRGREMCKGPGVEVTWHVWRITVGVQLAGVSGHRLSRRRELGGEFMEHVRKQLKGRSLNGA